MTISTIRIIGLIPEKLIAHIIYESKNRKLNTCKFNCCYNPLLGLFKFNIVLYMRYIKCVPDVGIFKKKITHA